VLRFKSALFYQLYFQNWSGRDLRSLKDVFTVLLAILTFAAELWENNIFQPQTPQTTANTANNRKQPQTTANNPKTTANHFPPSLPPSLPVFGLCSCLRCRERGRGEGGRGRGEGGREGNGLRCFFALFAVVCGCLRCLRLFAVVCGVCGCLRLFAVFAVVCGCLRCLCFLGRPRKGRVFPI
jgi:hypothetical protein